MTTIDWWCAAQGLPATEGGGCPACDFRGKPTKYGFIRAHKIRTTKPDDEIDDQRHRHLTPDAFCEWCGEVDTLGKHENGCPLTPSPCECGQVATRATYVGTHITPYGPVAQWQRTCEPCGRAMDRERLEKRRG